MRLVTLFVTIWPLTIAHAFVAPKPNTSLQYKINQGQNLSRRSVRDVPSTSAASALHVSKTDDLASGPSLLTRYSDDGFTLSTPQRYSVSNWAENLANIPQSQILQRVQSHLLFNFVWSCGLVALCYIPLDVQEIFPYPPVFDKLDLYVPFGMSSGILGILVAFRSNQSYDRFWQGRQIWVEVISTERSIARCLRYLDNPDDEYVPCMRRWLLTFPVALMQHLRGERSLSEFTALTDQDLELMEQSDNMPIACLMVLTELLNTVRLEPTQASSDLLWWQMDSLLEKLTHAIGAGEAIAGTPVPLSYTRHTSRLLSLWTILCPLVLIQAIPPLAVPFVTLVLSWTLLATEEIGHIIEEPFGIHDDRPNILNLDRYCEIIANDIQLMSATNVMLDGYSFKGKLASSASTDFKKKSF